MRAVVLLLSAISLFGQGSATHSLAGGSPVPQWSKYTVTAIANGVNGCANGAGCWQVNSATPVAKTAGLTQSVSLFNLPANGYVTTFRIKSATACTGTTTLLSGLGTASSANLFLVSAVTGYDLKAAVSATNISTIIPLVMGSNTAASVDVVASLTSTIDNLSAVVDGCSVNYWVLWGILP